MRSLIVAGAVAAVLGTGLVTPGTAEADGRHSDRRESYSHRSSSRHYSRPYYRPSYRAHYRPRYRTYYRPYYRPYYYAPPVYYGADPYYYGYGGGYCRRPSVGLYFGY